MNKNANRTENAMHVAPASLRNQRNSLRTEQTSPRTQRWTGIKRAAALGFAWFALALLSGFDRMAWAQQPAGNLPSAAVANPDRAVANPDSKVVGDDTPPAEHSADATPEGRDREAWKLLTDAMADARHPQTRIQGLAALGLLRSARSEKMITDAMADPDVDVRTAAVLAAGQTRDPNLTTAIRNLLDDKEPQVAFTAATTLWKMGDKSGEDILVSVVDGERRASATMMHGTEHRLSKSLHDPATLARLGATEGAAMMLGPFGFGITAYEYVHQNGGDLARVSAIEQISQERTGPIHQELVAALVDKDQTVRAAAAKALVDDHDQATSTAVYTLLVDPRQPVRLTAAAAYLRTTGVAGPLPAKAQMDTTSPHKSKRWAAPK